MRLFEGGNVRSRVEDGMELDAVVCVRAEMHGALDEATQVAKVRRHRWNKHRPALAAARGGGACRHGGGFVAYEGDSEFMLTPRDVVGSTATLNTARSGHRLQGAL
jgi:hypothetical protein